MALLLPAIYVAFISFHPGLIPWQLTIFIQSSRGGVPFSTFIETFLMGCTIECLREAGIRLPKSGGQAVGIVGGTCYWPVSSRSWACQSCYSGCSCSHSIMLFYYSSI
ncbi:spore germination protein [Bacillus cereus]